MFSNHLAELRASDIYTTLLYLFIVLYRLYLSGDHKETVYAFVHRLKGEMGRVWE